MDKTEASKAALGSYKFQVDPENLGIFLGHLSKQLSDSRQPGNPENR
jgi:hypothetical protein